MLKLRRIASTEPTTKILVLCMALLTASSCAGGPQQVNAQLQGSRFILSIKPGPSYESWAWWFIFPYKKTPQMACWLETPDGSFVQTIFATSRVAKGDWRDAPRAGRPESLPVWMAASQGAKLSADAIAAATPSADFQGSIAAPSSADVTEYVVKFEINKSYDYNEFYPKDGDGGQHLATGVNGQPSVIYSGRISTGAGNSTVSLQPVGTGALNGEDGRIRPGLAGLTTALEIVQSVQLSWTE